MTRTPVAVGAALAACMTANSTALIAQRPLSQWDGIYTEAQATRGETLYSQQCASCHGLALEGLRGAPPLTGGQLEATWNFKPLSDLVQKIQATMPPEARDRLTPQAVVDVVAFVLRVGNYPSGRTELSSKADDLKGITVLARKP
jgi:mono/diheme cytochrome c family protein